MYKCIYYGIKELVSPIVYNKWGEQAWMFFSPDVLEDLDTIRETWKSPIIINNWFNGGSLKQCGLRSNLDQIPIGQTKANNPYLSAHTMGKAFDLHDSLGRNQKLYNHVLNLIKGNKLKAFKRLENYNKTNTGGGWVHVDAFQADNPIF